MRLYGMIQYVAKINTFHKHKYRIEFVDWLWAIENAMRFSLLLFF